MSTINEAFESLGKRVSVRLQPTVRADTIGYVQPFQKIEYTSIVGDIDHPFDKKYLWFRLGTGGYCNYFYPPNGERFILDPTFGFVLHDHQYYTQERLLDYLYNEGATKKNIDRVKAGLWGVSRPERNELAGKKNPAYGLPETIKLVFSQFVVLTEEIQVWWFQRLKLSAPPKMTEKDLKNAWHSLLTSDRFITNFFGSDKCADYINHTHLDNEPMKYEPIVTGGAYLQLFGNPFSKYGQLNYKIKAIDARKPLPNINQFTNPELFFYATNSTRTALSPHVRQVDPFPQLQGRGVPIPIFATNPFNAIVASRIQVLPKGAAVPSPYVRE